MATKQGSPVRDKAEWLLQFAVMSLVTRRKQPWEHRVQGRHVLLSGAKGLHGPLSRRFETQGPSDRYVINAMDVLTEVGDRLRTCKRPGCGRAFIAVKRQEHCIDCAKAVQTARVASWRKRNPQ